MCKLIFRNSASLRTFLRILALPLRETIFAADYKSAPQILSPHEDSSCSAPAATFPPTSVTPRA